MKIKFLTSFATPAIGYKKGQTADLPDHTARALIAAGDAEEHAGPDVPEPKPDPNKTDEQNLAAQATPATVNEVPRPRQRGKLVGTAKD